MSGIRSRRMLQIRQNKIMATVDDVPTWLALAFERVVEGRWFLGFARDNAESSARSPSVMNTQGVPDVIG